MLYFLKNRGLRQAVKRWLERAYEQQLMHTDFAIISNNCWGYQLYQSLGREYNTPFIGLFLHDDCYIKFISSMEFYLDCPFVFTRKSKYYSEERDYPVGVICGDIEIHFMHYESEEECLSKWSRRTKRLQSYMNQSRPVFLKLCDRDATLSGLQVLQKFHGINRFKKISFSASSLPHGSALMLNACDVICDKGVLRCNLIGPDLYAKRYKYFDIVEWVKYGRINHTIWSRCLGLLA